MGKTSPSERTPIVVIGDDVVRPIPVSFPDDGHGGAQHQQYRRVDNVMFHRGNSTSELYNNSVG